MRVSNKRVEEAISLLEESFGENFSFDLRTENDVPHMTSKKYILYAPKWEGTTSGAYGKYIESFDTQKEFVNWVSSKIQNDVEERNLYNEAMEIYK